MSLVVLSALKPATHRLLVMHPLADKLNANLGCAAVAMLLCILCCNVDENQKQKPISQFAIDQTGGLVHLKSPLFTVRLVLIKLFKTVGNTTNGLVESAFLFLLHHKTTKLFSFNS